MFGSIDGLPKFHPGFYQGLSQNTFEQKKSVCAGEESNGPAPQPRTPAFQDHGRLDRPLTGTRTASNSPGAVQLTPKLKTCFESLPTH